MVNVIEGSCIVNTTLYNIEDLISSTQLKNIIESCTKTDRYDVEKLILKEATQGLAGFLGDHLRLSIHVKLEGGQQEIKLFIKCMPMGNQPKVDFMKSCKFYNREQFVFNELFKEAGGSDEPNPWRPPVYVCTDELVVMPDMAVAGYTMHDKMLPFDLHHCLLSLSAVAKYHAASVDYETRKSQLQGHNYSILDEFSDVLVEYSWIDCPWMTAGAKTTARFLGTLSKKYNYNSPHYKTIESKLTSSFIAACDSLKRYEGTLNVVAHKDLWSNNILFKYDGVRPSNAVLLDFQCVRYGPPAFDLTSFLYLNTSRSFREMNERRLLVHYYESFLRALSPESSAKLNGYTFDVLMEYVERSRAFGLLVAVMLFPYIKMDAVTAKATYDDPATFDHYVNVDRSEPVIALARKDQLFRDSLLEVCEEFVEKFVLSRPV